MEFPTSWARLHTTGEPLGNGGRSNAGAESKCMNSFRPNQQSERRQQHGQGFEFASLLSLYSAFSHTPCGMTQKATQSADCGFSSTLRSGNHSFGWMSRGHVFWSKHARGTNSNTRLQLEAVCTKLFNADKRSSSVVNMVETIETIYSIRQNELPALSH